MALPAAPTSGNRRSRKSKLCCRVTVLVGVMLVAYQALWSYYLAGYNIPDVEIDESGRKRIRRRPHLLTKKHNGEEHPT